MVHEADVQDPDGSKEMLKQVKAEHPQVALVWTDARYRSVVAWAQEHLDIVLEIVEKIDLPGFHISPRRWVVERTFAWYGKCRRLSKDYEYLKESSESWLDIVMSRLFLRRLALTVI